MKTRFKTYVNRTIGIVGALAVGWVAASIASPLVLASDAMPVSQQNALVQKYCAVCHTDAHMNGGLSLEHFDAAHPDPGVAAMLVSKLTAGLSPKQLVAPQQHDPNLGSLIASKMKAGAMGAAGVPVPDRATQDALVSALSEEAAGASEWTSHWTQNPAAPTRDFTASIVREVPSAAYAGDTDMYRLTLTCRADTREAEVLLAWAPAASPVDQVMSVAVDRHSPFTYKVESGEKMFKGAVGTMGTGAAILYTTQKNSGSPMVSMPLPSQTLTVSNLFPNETVVFPFGTLGETARKELSTCFAASAGR